MNQFSKKEALTFGWDTFKKDPWIFVGVVAFVIIVSFLFQNVVPDDASLMAVLLGVATTITQWWLYLGFTRIMLAAHAGSPITFKMLFGESWETLWHYIVATVITIVVVVIGYILLIVPGVIAQIGLLLTVFLIVEKSMKPIDALKESWRLTKGHRWNIFLFMLLLGLVNILGVIAFGIGLLVSLPVTFLALTWMYKQIERGMQLEPVKPLVTPAPNI